MLDLNQEMMESNTCFDNSYRVMCLLAKEWFGDLGYIVAKLENLFILLIMPNTSQNIYWMCVTVLGGGDIQWTKSPLMFKSPWVNNDG